MIEHSMIVNLIQMFVVVVVVVHFALLFIVYSCFFLLSSLYIIQFVGSLQSTMINGLNLATDIVRWDSPSTNTIQASKQFQSLSIGQLICTTGCTLQDVNMDEWITKSVLIGLNNTIQGTVIAKDAVISYAEVLGFVNGMKFDSLNILLKNVPQTIHGSLTIGSQSNFDSINSITFNNLMVNYINEKNVSEFFEHLVLKDQHHGAINVGEIFTDIIFQNQLEIDDLHITFDFNGLNVQQAHPSHFNIYNEQFRAANDELDEFTERLNRRGPFKYFNGTIVRDWIAGEFQSIQKLTGHEFIYVALNNSNIEFYQWNNTNMTLQESNSKLCV